MDDLTIISNFCKPLATFCKHLQNSSVALKESLERRPIPLDSASSTFIQCLNRRVSSASSDLNLLESMACGTVSFEELLGHCNQLYKKNQAELVELEQRLKNFGYIPTDDEEEVLVPATPIGLDVGDGLNLRSLSCVPPSATVGSKSIIRRLEDEDLFDDSLSLQNLGLSDVCLATIASEGNGKYMGLEVPYPPTTRVLEMTLGDVTPAQDPEPVVTSTITKINLSRVDYDNLPSFMKNLASWEDLVAAVEKMNSTLKCKEKPEEQNLFYQEELGTLGLGPKVRSYVVMLVRMKRLVVETVDGSIVYRVL